MHVTISVKPNFLLIGEDEDQEFVMSLEEEPITDNSDSSLTVFPEFSMHALAGRISPRIIRVKGIINNHYVHILIDS